MSWLFFVFNDFVLILLVWEILDEDWGSEVLDWGEVEVKDFVLVLRNMFKMEIREVGLMEYVLLFLVELGLILKVLVIYCIEDC